MKKLLTASGLCLALALGSTAYAAPEAKHSGPPPHVQAALAKLPADKQALVKKTFADSREAGKANHEKVKALHKEIREILVAPEFDRAAYLAKHKQVQYLMAEGHAKRVEAMADLASKLTAEERKVLAEAMPKPGKWAGKHRKGGKPAEAKPAVDPAGQADGEPQ